MSARYIVSLTQKPLSDIFEDILYDNNVSKECECRIESDFNYDYNQILLHILDHHNECDKYGYNYPDLTCILDNTVIINLSDEYKLFYDNNHVFNKQHGFIIAKEMKYYDTSTNEDKEDYSKIYKELEKYIVPFNIKEE